MSLLSLLFKLLLFLVNSVSKSPFIRPNQFLYANNLSSASTVATLSSQSIIVDIADSNIISAI